MVALYVFPSILLLDFLICYFPPCTYPTTNLKDIVRVRSLENQPPLISSVSFVDVPINTKQRIGVTLDSLIEMDVEYTEEIYLTGYGALTFINTSFLSFEEVLSLTVLFEGRSLDYYCFENEGQKYYVMENFTVIQKEKIYKFEIFSTIKPRIRASKFINTPWIFNENYARVIYLPLAKIAVQTNKSSDLCTISVNMDIPYRRILMDESGWTDLFVCPPYEWKEWVIEATFFWEETGPKPVIRVLPSRSFDYSIEQESRNEKNLYIFSTHFSEDNIASKISLLLIPKVEVILIPLIFLLFPLFFNFFYPNFGHEKNSKMKNNKKKTSEGRTHIIKAISTRIFWLYTGPILSLVGLFVTGTPILVFGFIREITNPFMFWLILIYPILLAFVSYFSGKDVCA